MSAASETVEINGVRIGFRRAGQGPPLVLLHGIYGDSRNWAPQLEALADEFTVVAWDAPGAGRSDDPPDSFGFPEYADCLAGLIGELGLGRSHVCAFSYSGGIALELCRRRPELIASLTLVGAYAGWGGSLPVDKVEARLGRALAQADLGGEAAARQFIPELFAPGAPAELVEESIALSSSFHPAGLRVMARASAAADLRAVLPQVAVPTLVVHGREDRRSPLSVSEDLHAGIPDSRLAVVDGAGHMVNLEAPAEFDRLLRGFLREATA
jgi:pimeloyl-ACP methyl ester carboxylesterase